MYRNKRWKDRKRQWSSREVGGLIDEWAMEKQWICQLYTQPAPDSRSVYHDPIWPRLLVSVCVAHLSWDSM